MGLVQDLENSKIISIDTTVLIYFIEKHPKYFDLIHKLFSKVNTIDKPFKLVTSVITLIEVLTKLFREHKKELVSNYYDILLFSENVFVVMLEVSIAKITAELRSKYMFLKTPDAIQLATAIYSEAEYFLTNDSRLKDVTEVRVVILDDLLLNVS